VFSLPSTAHPIRLLPLHNRLPHFTSLLLGSAVALLMLVLGALSSAPAQAALISTATCNEATLSQPFLRWGDTSLYELVPGGDFEGSLAGWTLDGGAQRVAGSEPYGVTGAMGAYSLALPQGASAQSPFTCVDAAYPTFRFFARNDGLLGTVVVQVVYKTALGTVSLPLGAVVLSREWEPTLPMLTGSLVTGVLSGGTAEVALRFTALTGSSHIDDVFVDPRMH
jgi:hypothetical protein